MSAVASALVLSSHLRRNRGIRNRKRVTRKCESMYLNRTQVWVLGGFGGCREIFKMAGDGHESHVPVLRFKSYLIIR